MNWKPITEIPTERYEKNHCVSPDYIVLCEGTCGNNNLPNIGIGFYSFATEKWCCWEHLGEPRWDFLNVIGWTDNIK